MIQKVINIKIHVISVYNLFFFLALEYLYTETGHVVKGGVQLKTYRCARGSSSLESFHAHLKNFIPGKYLMNRQALTYTQRNRSHVAYINEN